MDLLKALNEDGRIIITPEEYHTILLSVNGCHVIHDRGKVIVELITPERVN
jgi:hypothetical protein